MAIVYYGRDYYNIADKRADIVGAEIEESQPIKLYPDTGLAKFFVRLVTQFETSGSSIAHAVGSKEITVTFDAMATTLTKLINDAKQQNQLKNGSTVVISGTL